MNTFWWRFEYRLARNLMLGFAFALAWELTSQYTLVVEWVRP
jgi:hypothetical protein